METKEGEDVNLEELIISIQADAQGVDDVINSVKKAMEELARAADLANQALASIQAQSGQAAQGIGGNFDTLMNGANTFIAVISAFDRAQKAEAQAMRDSIEQQKEARASLATLSREYGVLSGKTSQTESDKKRLLGIEQELATEHGVVRDSVLDQADAYDSLATAMNKSVVQSREDIIELQKKALEASIKAGDANLNPFLPNDKKYKDAYKDALSYISASVSTGFDEIDQMMEQKIGTMFEKAYRKNNDLVKKMNLIDQFIGDVDLTKLDELKTTFDAEWSEILGANGVLEDSETDDFNKLVNKMVAEATESFKSMREFAANTLGYTGDELQALDADIEKTILAWLGLPEVVAQNEDGLYLAAEAFKAVQLAQANLGEIEVKVKPFDMGNANTSAQAIMDNYQELIKAAYDLQIAQEDLNIITGKSTSPLEKQAAALRLNAAGYGYLLDNIEGLEAAQKLVELRTGQSTEAITEQSAELDKARAWINQMMESAADSAPYEALLAQLDLVSTQSVATFTAAEQAARDAALATVDAYEEAMPQLNDMLSHLGFRAIEGSLADITGLTGELGDRLEAVQAKIDAYVASGADVPQGLLDTRDLLVLVKEYIDLIGGTSSATLKSSFDPMTASADELEKELAGLVKQSNTLKATMNDKRGQSTQINGWKKIISAYKDGQDNAADYTNAVKEMGDEYGYVGNSADAALTYIDFLCSHMDSQLSASAGEAEAVAQSIYEIMMAANQRSEINVDTTEAEKSIQMLLGILEDFYALAPSDVTTNKSGGGGGKSKKEKEAEEARKAAEEAARAQEEAYQQQLKQIDHKRKMDQITAEEELEALERVKQKYARTADQIMDIDERIFAAREALREQEIEQLDKLNDGIIDALEARYEAQREAEQKRIDESITAWEKWADDTCASIQAQIDALDEKAKAEDREAQAAEKTRKIENLEQQMAYETDEYNLRQLQKQLDKAIEDWEKTQKDWALSDQKDALQAQMDAVQEQADSEIERLEGESERIDAYYDGLTDAASLAAEAQRMLMESSQQDILELMSEFAPNYEATGKTLGERFYDGFKDALQDIGAWFEDFNMAMEDMQLNAAQGALSAIDAAHASGGGVAQTTAPVEITQNVNFFSTVESPVDIFNKLQLANEGLAAMI